MSSRSSFAFAALPALLVIGPFTHAPTNGREVLEAMRAA
jgi:hypothetical protein